MSILIDGTNGLTFPDSSLQAVSATNATNISSGTLPFARLPTGSVLQVIQTYLPSSFSTSSGSWTDWTGMTATITPKFSTSKILITLTSGVSNNTQDTFQFVKLVRNSTDIALGNTAGSATRCWIDASQQTAGAVNVYQKGLAGSYLDSPATTSATTYKLQVIVTRIGTAYFGQTADTSDANRSAIPSVLTLMEIAA